MWVDINKKTINLFDLSTSKNRSLKFEETVSAVIPVRDCSSKLLALLGKKICLVDRENGSLLEVLSVVQEDKPKNRFNDAKCDSAGRLWCGTMESESSPGVLEPKQGMLFCYSKGSTEDKVTTSLSNGLDWNADNDVMYYIDTYSYNLYTFAFNSQTGSISQQEVLIDYSQDKELAFPDGMCRDTKGRLWVASFGGQCVTCWDPKTRQRVMTLRIPGARRITSCCFGGPDYAWLLVTSAMYGAGKEELAENPNSGALFVVKDLGARGTPAHRFVE